MPFLAVPDGVQVELVHLLAGSICTTAPIFLDRGGETPSDPVALADTVDGWWRTSVLPNLSVNLFYTHYQWRRLDAPDSPVTQTVHAPPLIGGMGGNCHPANVSVRVNLRREPGTFGNTGCLFVPGIPHFASTGNTLHADWRAAVEAAYTDLIAAALAAGWEWAVINKIRHGELLPAARRLPVYRATIDSPYTGQRRSRLHNEPL